MTLVMAYVILIAASISACAVVLESVLRSRGLAGRWIWVTALGLTALATVLTMVVPRPSVTEVSGLLIETPLMVSSEGVAKISSKSPVVSWDALFTTVDRFLPAVWGFASIVLLIAIGVGQRRLRRERMLSRAAELAGHRVLLTEATGPAVAGIREPVVFVPHWVLALDEPSQRLLLTHEMEHVKRRDTAVLFTGALAIAVLPWNPAVWWMVRRLRLAVEQDCDARVLAVHPGVRRYADLLLMAASRHGLASRLLAAHFGEHTSDLMRRIEAMTSRERFPWRRIAGATLAASALIVVACETPRPDPVAPIRVLSETPAAAGAVEEKAYVESRKVSDEANGLIVFVLASDGSQLGRYAGEIPVADLPADGIQRIKAEEGRIWITLKPGRALNVKTTELLKAAHKILTASDSSTFKVSEMEIVGDKSTMLMSDAKLTALSGVLPGTVSVSGSAVETKIAAIREDSSAVYTSSNPVVEQEVPQPTVRIRDWKRLSEPMPNILVRRADGSELRRFIAESARANEKSPIDELKSDDIAAIEVYKGRSCPSSANIGCPLIVITLKAGRDQAYRPR